jgi:peptide/nickel transport system permease protein
MKAFKKSFQDILQYPSAVAGLVLISILVIVAIAALFTYSYDEAVTLWRGTEENWYQNPKYAPPVWTNWFSSKKEPLSFKIANTDPDVDVQRGETSTGAETIYTFTFDYQYDDFPQDVALFFKAKYAEKQPFASIAMLTPDGRELRVADFGLNPQETYTMGQDDRLTRRLGGLQGEIGLFADPNVEGDEPQVLKGTYQLTITILDFEPDSSVSVEYVSYGKVHGWAGTDHLRRDLSVALLYGTPIALVFGLVAAIGVNILTIIFAATGVWYGGVVDGLIQRVTEVNLTLPFLSILIMVGTFYSKSIWVLLGLTILLGIFGGAIKGYRAIFMQVKESTYIEAAQAYGASSRRIIFLYLIPRIIPMLIPALVLAIPGFVFLEASLAVLGLGDPVLPTWGKIINDANTNAALYNGYYYWILEPAVLLMITGLAFAMVGFSLDRIFNPRLREV